MPPTIRDAIHVTEKLGLHLLWADALCIVQDDPQDKALEISAMADIYASGTITIMASRSSSVDQGFLYRRFPFGTTASDQGIKLACRTRAGKQGSAIAVPDFWGAEEPLDTRGWAFQEYLLSPRILSYGQLHTMWVCDGRARCSERRDQRSDGVADMPLSSNDNTAKLRERMLDINGTSSLDDRPPPEDLYSVWYNMLHQYMGRRLTYPTDRLPALAAVAQQMHSILGDEYFAGLWSGSIVKGAHVVPYRRTNQATG